MTSTDLFGWSYANSGLPQDLPYVTDLAMLASDFNTAYATLSGFGPAHVFRTRDGGASWQNLTGNLPTTPVNSVAVDPQFPLSHIFVGTDVGVFETVNGGSTWVPLMAGFPNVSVNMVRLQQSTGTLFAATYGRGVFALLNAVSLLP